MSADTPSATDAVSVWTPGASPSVHVVLARPAASVSTAAGSADPCPSAGEKVTVAPATGEPPASSARTTTASASVPPAIPSCPSPDTTTRAVGTCATTTWAVALSASNDAVSVPDPFATALTIPVGVTVNTPVSLLDQDDRAGVGRPELVGDGRAERRRLAQRRERRGLGGDGDRRGARRVRGWFGAGVAVACGQRDDAEEASKEAWKAVAADGCPGAVAYDGTASTRTVTMSASWYLW